MSAKASSRVRISMCACFRPTLIVVAFYFLTGLPVNGQGKLVTTQVNVTTQHYDISRSGQNINETILTPANVNSGTFGLLFSYPVDGYVYAQPLYMSGLIMGAGTPQAGTTHNVVFVATEHDTVYAFDADSNLSAANSQPLWKASLLDSAHGAAAGATSVPNGDTNTTDILPEIGITGTPVIDPTTNTLYVVSATKENGTYPQRLHALDITTGAEKFGGPVTLAASVPGNGNGSSGGTLKFDPKWENQRPGLLLLNGIVYIAFSAHEDTGPWHGWILAYSASTMKQTGFWCASPNGTSGGIWMSGAALAADVPDPTGHPFGRMFVPTGNGSYNAAVPYDTTMSYGESILNFDLTNGLPTVKDLFTPHDQANLDVSDKDVASGGVLILPSAISGGQNLLTQVGKSGRIYILNRENLGGYTPTNTKDPEEKAYIQGAWSSPAYWNGNLYFWASGDHLRAFSFNNGVISTTATSVSAENSGFPGATPVVTANGTTNGIVWDVRTEAFSDQAAEILYAHDAKNVATTLYTSLQNAVRDNPGNAVKFVVPTVINGKVYVGAEYQISVFGLLNGATQASMPVISPASESFNPSVQVSITDSTPNAVIYYTTDGSRPTTSSTVYTGTFNVTSTGTVQAMAVVPSGAAGSLQSPIASATYTFITQAAIPSFSPSPGEYTSAQSVAISTVTQGATIYYTTDGSTPSTSSTKYTGPVAINSSTTLQAIAAAPNLTNSAVASGTYTINAGAGSSIDFGSGFSPGGMLQVNKAKLSGTRLRITDGGITEADAAWYPTQVNIQTFSTDFLFQITNPVADGFTFTIQNKGTTAVGPSGGGLGYGAALPGGTPGIPTSVAVKFDLFSNSGEGNNSTGLYTNGASPTKPATALGGGVNLHSGDVFGVHMSYDGTTLTMTITDQSVPSETFTTSWPINIPGTVGGNTAYVGFTGGTGSKTSTQDILSWTYSSAGAGQQTTATPAIMPPTGTYTAPQTVSITDATSGAIIHYTVDGTQPTTASTQYNGSFSVSATTTVKAMAAASGFTNSATATSVITIGNSTAATPVISPATGTFASSQTVTITDSTSGAAIFYTLDGSQPTTSSPQYTGSFVVSTTTTVKAVAGGSGFTTSGTATSVITIQSGGTSLVNFGSGFTASGLQFNGHAKLNGTRLQLTNTVGQSQAGSAWWTTPVNVQSFTNDFTFQLSTPNADGFTFTIQDAGTTAIGPSGGGLGYGAGLPGGTPGIPTSVAVKFDLFQNSHEGNNSTGIYTDGASPTSPATTLGGGVNLHSGDIMQVHMTYDGTTLTMTITDTVNTSETFTISWPINIPGTVGANTAFVGFTGGTGGQTSTQEILTWTYTH